MTPQKIRLDRVVFLDRDGVINKDSRNYIKSCGEFVFLPGSLKAIKHLTDKGFEIILITNQSVIGRKMVTPEGLEMIFEKLQAGVIASGGKIRDIFFCPHTPEEGCRCRKPLPGMIENAQQKYEIDLTRAFMVGDSVKDMACAQNAGCGHAVLVRTGNGKESEEILKKQGPLPDFIADSLCEAAEWIVSL